MRKSVVLIISVVMVCVVVLLGINLINSDKTEDTSIDEKLEVILDDEQVSLKDITVDQMKSVHIYSVSVEKGGEYSDEELSQIELKSTEEPEVYFGKIEYCDDRVLWKGDNLGVIHMKDGSDIRVRISSYGNFFALVGEKGYYKYKKEI